MKKVLRHPLTLIVISLVYFIFMAELFSSFLLGDEPGDIPSPQFSIFNVKGGMVTLKKEQKGTLHTKPFRFHKNIRSKRIFVFGGSSVYNLSLTRMSSILEKKFPRKRFEIINLGANSYGSLRIYHLMREALAFKPDLFLLYSGHNEFSEKFILEFLSVSGRLERLQRWFLGHSHTYRLMHKYYTQWATELAEEVVKKGNRGQISKFPTVPNSDWNLKFDKEKVYSFFSNNLERMINLKVPMIMATVAYNRMKPPFHEKLPLYQNCPKERSCLEKALDRDLTPHRADNQINAIIREKAKEHAIPLVDIDQAIIKISKDGIPGNEEFYDHCHLKEDYDHNIVETLFAKKIIEIMQ